jgi:TonB-linked SusC/RagA family outer membrane protein
MKQTMSPKELQNMANSTMAAVTPKGTKQFNIMKDNQNSIFIKLRKAAHYALPCLMLLASATLSAQDESDSTMTVRRAPRVQKQKYPTTPVSGTVRDAATGEVLPGVQIYVYGDKDFAAMTDDKGTYTIGVPRFATSLLLIADGYNDLQVSLGGRSKNVDVRLFSTQFLPDYRQTTDARRATVAEEMGLNNDFSIDGAISRQLGADVRSLTRSGMNGVGANMLVAGINSLSANAHPLIVIDGVLMDMQYNSTMLHEGYYNNILANLSVDDIERVTVLKNGTAIYGAQGANGVILVDTKRNKSMATKIDVNIGGSWQQTPHLMEMMDASQYRAYASELLGTTSQKSNDFVFLQSDPNYYYYNKYHNNTDWSKTTYRDAWTQKYSMNVQGGDVVADYNLSVGYATGNSTLKRNNYSRFNLRLNSDIWIASNVSVRFDASYSDVNRDLRDDGATTDLTNSPITSPGFLSMLKAPFLSPYAHDKYGNVSQFLAGSDDYLSGLLNRTSSLGNPASILYYGEGKNKNDFGNRFINLAITPKWDINKHLSLSEHFSYTLTNTNENYYLPITGQPTFKVIGIGTVNNVAKALSARCNMFSSDTYADWNNQYGAHYIDARGGVRYLDNLYKMNSQQGYNSGNDKTPNMSTGLKYKTTGGMDESWKMMTWYATAGYNYMQKYYLNASVAMETSSRYGDDVKAGVKIGGMPWGIFPSVEGAWVLSNEKWFHPLFGINYLKLNAGLDMTGNNDVDNTASKSYFTDCLLLQSVDGLVLSNIGNTRLRWETTKRLTAGFELNAFNNHLNVAFNYFRSRTDNLLSLKQLSLVTGIENNWSNDGKLKNEGFDVTATVKLVNTKDWQWSIGASAGHYVNKVTQLPNDKTSFQTSLYDGTVITRVGSPVGLFYGFRTQGVYSTTEAATADGLYTVTPTGQKVFFQAGDMRFVDTNNDGIISDGTDGNPDDRTVIGDPNPDIYGNISTSLSFKRLRLDAVFTYSLGNDIYNYQRSVLEGGGYFYNQTTALQGRWMSEGQVTDVPRISYEDVHGNSRFSDRWIEDGSYLRLRTLTLSYVTPIHNTYLQGLTLWVAGDNLLTLTRYLGSDPEFSMSNNVLTMGIDRGLVGQSRGISFGAKINL